MCDSIESICYINRCCIDILLDISRISWQEVFVRCSN